MDEEAEEEAMEEEVEEGSVTGDEDSWPEVEDGFEEVEKVEEEEALKMDE